MMRRAWTLEVTGWALAAGALVLVGIVGLLVWLWPRPAGIDPARVYRACEQYASLDLSGLAAICRDAGYQQTAAQLGPSWPTTLSIQPEDLDR